MFGRTLKCFVIIALAEKKKKTKIMPRVTMLNGDSNRIYSISKKKKAATYYLVHAIQPHAIFTIMNVEAKLFKKNMALWFIDHSKMNKETPEKHVL